MLLAGLIASLLLLWLQPQGDIANAYPYIFGMWSKPALSDWMVLALLTLFAIGIGMMLAGAYQAAPPPIVTPTATSLTGMALIVAAGLLVLHRGNPVSV